MECEFLSGKEKRRRIMALDQAYLIAKIIIEESLDNPEVQKELKKRGLTKEEFYELHDLEIAVIRKALEEIPERMVLRLLQTDRPHYKLEEVQQIIKQATKRALFGEGTRWSKIKDIIRVLIR